MSTRLRWVHFYLFSRRALPFHTKFGIGGRVGVWIELKFICYDWSTHASHTPDDPNQAASSTINFFKILTPLKHFCSSSLNPLTCDSSHWPMDKQNWVWCQICDMFLPRLCILQTLIIRDWALGRANVIQVSNVSALIVRVIRRTESQSEVYQVYDREAKIEYV
jgi:hypothetical protein